MKLAVPIMVFLLGYNTYCRSISDPYTYVVSGENIDWPSKSVKRLYTSTDKFICENIIPTRFQCFGLWAVITFPRLRPGVPITLGRIPLIANQRLPTIKPFPSWEMQDIGSADAIQNAVDIFLDDHNILWVLDTGTINTLTYAEETGSPRVFGIHFLTGKVRYDIELTTFAEEDNGFQNILVENGAGRPFIYISCAESGSIIVYDVIKKRGERIHLPNSYFRGDVLYIALLRPRNRELILAISPRSNQAIFGIDVCSLRNGRLGQLTELGTKKDTMIVLGTDNGSKIFFRWMDDPTRIRVWDIDDADHERGSIIWEGDESRKSTQVSTGSRFFTWSLESNFHDFVDKKVGKVGPSALLRPLLKDDQC